MLCLFATRDGQPKHAYYYPNIDANSTSVPFNKLIAMSIIHTDSHTTNALWLTTYFGFHKTSIT